MSHDNATRQESTAFGLEQAERVAPAWRKWGPVFAQRTDLDRYLELAGVESGQRVLEVGAGTGDQTLALAERVGVDGHVLATDLSPSMLEVAEDRVREAGIRNVRFAVGGGAEIDLPERTFDAAVSGFTLMLTPDPTAVAANVHRALRPGARFVASVWGPPPTAPMFALAIMTTFGTLGIQPPPQEGPGLFSLADPARLQQVLESAGFDDVSARSYPFPFTFRSADEYATFLRDVAPPISDLITDHAPERADEVWDAITGAARSQAAEDGSVTFENQALFVVGRRSA